MDELDIVRGLMLRTAGALPATAPLAKALLEWAEPHRPWLLPDMEGEWSWESLLPVLPPHVGDRCGRRRSNSRARWRGCWDCRRSMRRCCA